MQTPKNTKLSRNLGTLNYNTTPYANSILLHYAFKSFRPKPEVSGMSVTAVYSIINKAPIREGIEKLSWGLKVNPNDLKRHTDTLTIIQYVPCLKPMVQTTQRFKRKLRSTNLKKTPYILNKTIRCPTGACDSPPTYSVFLLNTRSIEVKNLSIS